MENTEENYSYPIENDTIDSLKRDSQYAPDNSEYSLPLADTWSEFVIYGKSKLFIFELSKEILVRTEWEYNIDDFMGVIYQECILNSRYCNNYVIQNSLETMTGASFADLFESYVFGNEILDISWAFEDPDEDLMPSGLEVLLDSNFMVYDSDGDGFGDGEEFNAGTDMLDISSFPTPKPTSTPPPTYTPTPTESPTSIPTEISDWSV